MGVSVLVIFFVLCVLWSRASPIAGPSAPRPWRGCLLTGAIIFAATLVAITELLSLFEAISYSWVLGSWIAAAGIPAIYLILVHRKARRRREPHPPKLSRFEVFLIGAVAFICLVTFVIAVLAPPNTWDSMTYHLARIGHWIQNGSVAHYPTHILRQLYMPPWSEFAMMHVMVLCKTDRLVNLVQWFSMAGSLVAVSLIAKQLGASRYGQILAAVVCATIPMGILQSSSTQNDYVHAFWMSCVAYWTLSMMRDGPDLRRALGLGGSVGLAVLTKATAYIYAAPFLLWLLIWFVRKPRWRVWKYALLAAAAALVLNAGYYRRNLALFGAPLGGGSHTMSGDVQRGEGKYTNDVRSVPALLSNVSRNVSLHMGTKSKRINLAVEHAVRWMHKIFRIAPDDKRTTWTDSRFKVPRVSYHEDTTGNPLHLFLAAVCLVYFLALGTPRSHMTRALYIVVIIIEFLAFCFLLKWSGFQSRQHLTLFVLGAPFVAVVLRSSAREILVRIIVISLLLASMLWVFHNRSRTIIGRHSIVTTSRSDLYFRNSKTLKEPYLKAVKHLHENGVSRVGLVLGSNTWEYPFWVLLEAVPGSGLILEHVEVKNVSAARGYPPSKLEAPHAAVATAGTFRPDAVICIPPPEAESIQVGQGRYARSFAQGPVSIFLRSP